MAGGSITKGTVEGFAVNTEWNSNFVLAPPAAICEENMALGIPKSLSAEEVSMEGGWAPLRCTPFVVSEKQSMVSNGMMEPSGSLFPSRATTPAAHTVSKITNAVKAPFDVEDQNLAYLAKGIYSREDRQEMTESRVGTPKSPTDRPKSPPFFLTGVEGPLDGSSGQSTEKGLEQSMGEEKKKAKKVESTRSTPKEVISLTLRKKKRGKLGGARRWYSVRAKPSFIVAKPRELFLVSSLVYSPWPQLVLTTCSSAQRLTQASTTACSSHKSSPRQEPHGPID